MEVLASPDAGATSARPTLRFIVPQIPALVTEPPEGDGWIHEIKYDGYRTQLVVEDGACRAFTRRGQNWTDRCGVVIDCATGLGCDSAIIDGEMVVQDERGLTDFHALRRAIEGQGDGLIFFAFDLPTWTAATCAVPRWWSAGRS